MILIPATFESIRSLKDKTLKLTFESQELTPDQWGEIAKNNQSFGYLAFKKDPFKGEEKEAIESLKSDYEDKGKTPGQRLRGVLYRCWEQNNLGYSTFPDYYNRRMEELINHYKNKLE